MATKRWQDDVDRCIRELKVMRELVPFLGEHAGRGGIRAVTTDGTGSHAQGDHSDPTFDAVAERWHVGQDDEVPEEQHQADPNRPRFVRTASGRLVARIRPIRYAGGPHEEADTADAVRTLRAAMTELVRAAGEVTDHGRAADGALRIGNAPTSGLTHAALVALREGGRESSVDLRDCQICGRPTSRWPNGMDPACNEAWVTAGRPDKVQWKPKRLRWLEQHDRLPVQKAAQTVPRLDRGGWREDVHSTIGPADGVDRRAA